MRKNGLRRKQLELHDGDCWIANIGRKRMGLKKMARASRNVVAVEEEFEIAHEE